MAGRPQRRLRELQALLNPVEFDTSRAASMKEMKEKWGPMDTDGSGLGPWLPGNRERLVKTGAKLKPLVRVIMPDINNRFTVQQVTPELGVLKILVSSESAGPHELKGVNFWHRLFDDPGGEWGLMPEGMSRERIRDWMGDNVPNLARLRVPIPSRIASALNSSRYARRTGQTQLTYYPVVRTNRVYPGWVTSEDQQADAMASVLGYVRGLRYSVLTPQRIHKLKEGVAKGMTLEQAAEDIGFLHELPTPEEEQELRALFSVLEAGALELVQREFARAAAVGTVLLWEQPNAQGDTRGRRASDPSYVSSKSAIKKLMAKAKPPPGWVIS